VSPSASQKENPTTTRLSAKRRGKTSQSEPGPGKRKKISPLSRKSSISRKKGGEGGALDSSLSEGDNNNGLGG